jgi:hypothetical protein
MQIVFYRALPKRVLAMDRTIRVRPRHHIPAYAGRPHDYSMPSRTPHPNNSESPQRFIIRIGPLQAPHGLKRAFKTSRPRFLLRWWHSCVIERLRRVCPMRGLPLSHYWAMSISVTPFTVSSSHGPYPCPPGHFKVCTTRHTSSCPNPGRANHSRNPPPSGRAMSSVKGPRRCGEALRAPAPPEPVIP